MFYFDCCLQYACFVCFQMNEERTEQAENTENGRRKLSDENKSVKALALKTAEFNFNFLKLPSETK